VKTFLPPKHPNFDLSVDLVGKFDLLGNSVGNFGPSLSDNSGFSKCEEDLLGKGTACFTRERNCKKRGHCVIATALLVESRFSAKGKGSPKIIYSDATRSNTSPCDEELYMCGDNRNHFDLYPAATDNSMANMEVTENMQFMKDTLNPVASNYCCRCLEGWKPPNSKGQSFTFTFRSLLNTS
jgi:hypothetical protein